MGVCTVSVELQVTPLSPVTCSGSLVLALMAPVVAPATISGSGWTGHGSALWEERSRLEPGGEGGRFECGQGLSPGIQFGLHHLLAGCDPEQATNS